VHGRVGFNKDRCPPCADQERKSLLSSLPNTYMQIKPDVTLAWSSAMPHPMLHWQRHHATTKVALAVPPLARFGNIIISMTRQRHHATANVASAAASPARLGNAIA
jgi:hypothetical protein